MRWVVHGQNFVNAYHAVMRNQGAAGVDGMPTEALPKHLTHHWERIKAELLRGEYCPQPVRGVKIPKPSGGTRQLVFPALNNGSVVFLPGAKCGCWLLVDNQRLRACKWPTTNN